MNHQKENSPEISLSLSLVSPLFFFLNQTMSKVADNMSFIWRIFDLTVGSDLIGTTHMAH